MNPGAARYLLDTNILSDLIRNPQGAVRRRLDGLDPEQVCTSIIVACELRFGARKKNAPQLTLRVEQLLDTIEVLQLDAGVDRAYAEIRTALEIQGRPYSANDLLIAAHALVHECTLVTHNLSEFEAVPGLRVESWL